MAGRIPHHFIDELLSRVDIVDLVNQRVPLKRAGKEYQACCPFHDEKTPSFTVSPEKQFYHCFGCGAHGSAISFLMDYDNLGFIEAIEELATSTGLEVPREGGLPQGPDLRPLFQLMERTASYYRHQLRDHPQGQTAIDYLKQRGLTGEIAATFGIGFAPPGWDNLLQHTGQQSETLRQLRETGMITEGEGKHYDRFRNRIMFPIRDRRGRTIGFGGRILEDSTATDRAPKAAGPKYLNSPETPLFHKGRELYGLFEASQALRKIDSLLVVEGYMDVVALAQFGIRNVVATLGTATTKEHLELIFRICPEVIFCFDGDRAGRDAAWKALQTSLPVMREGREVRFLFLPDGEDPDTLVRKEGVEQFSDRAKAAMPLSRFLFDQLSSQIDMQSIDGRARLAQLAKPLLEQLPAGLFRQMMFQELEGLVGIKPGQLDSSTPQNQQGKPGSTSRKKYQQQRLTPLRSAIALLLDTPTLAQLAADTDDDWQQWQAPGVPLLRQLLELIRAQPTLNKAAIIERWRDQEAFAALDKLATYRFDLPGMDKEAEFRDAISRLNQQYRKQSAKTPHKLNPSELSEEERRALRQRFPGQR